MATKAKTTKRVTKKAPAKVPVKHKPVGECTMKECIQANKMLKMHIMIITVLSVAVCALVIALVLALKD